MSTEPEDSTLINELNSDSGTVEDLAHSSMGSWITTTSWLLGGLCGVRESFRWRWVSSQTKEFPGLLLPDSVLWIRRIRAFKKGSIQKFHLEGRHVGCSWPATDFYAADSTRFNLQSRTLVWQQVCDARYRSSLASTVYLNNVIYREQRLFFCECGLLVRNKPQGCSCGHPPVKTSDTVINWIMPPHIENSRSTPNFLKLVNVIYLGKKRKVFADVSKCLGMKSF